MIESTSLVLGMGATRVVGSDCYPATIVFVSSKLIGVVDDQYARIDSNGLSEDQQYMYHPKSSFQASWVKYFSLRKNGRWVERGARMHSGCALVIGHRRAYQDPSF